MCAADDVFWFVLEGFLQLRPNLKSIVFAFPGMPVTSDFTIPAEPAMELGSLTCRVRCATRQSSTALNVTSQQSVQCVNRVISDLTVAEMVFTMHVSLAGLLYVLLAQY